MSDVKHGWQERAPKPNLPERPPPPDHEDFEKLQKWALKGQKKALARRKKKTENAPIDKAVEEFITVRRARRWARARKVLVARYKKRYDDSCAGFDRLFEVAARLQARVTELEEGLKVNGMHEVGCCSPHGFWEEGEVCNCWLGALLTTESQKND